MLLLSWKYYLWYMFHIVLLKLIDLIEKLFLRIKQNIEKAAGLK